MMSFLGEVSYNICSAIQLGPNYSLLLCYQWRGDRVFHENGKRHHLAELNGSGLGGPLKREVDWQSVRTPCHLLQELRLWICTYIRNEKANIFFF